MVNFNDLSVEDQERLLEQAKLLIDEENIKKNAVATYKAKRKDLVESCLVDIYKHYNIKTRGVEEAPIRQRFTSIVNYLFRINVTGKYYSNSSAPTLIETSEDWRRFVKITEAVKDLFINNKEV